MDEYLAGEYSSADDPLVIVDDTAEPNPAMGGVGAA